MEITIRERDGVRIFDLVGKLKLDQGARSLYTAVRDELEQGRRAILLHLWEVSFIDSTGLGRLVACLTSASSRDAKVKLLRPSPRVEDVLKITGTDQLFEIFDDEEQAVQSFQQPDR
jgi:anti-sigma B factor antagonist